MPEGHTIHRAARDQKPMLVGKRLSVTSPQGRFAEGAALLDGARCITIEALGKHLLYHLDSARVLHIHLGLAGRIYRDPLPAEPPREVVRVRLMSDSHVIDITGPAICEVLEAADLDAFRMRYGPDLLSAHPEPERAIQRIRASRSNIATLLMNQRVISGIGNIYRSELLWLLRSVAFTTVQSAKRRPRAKSCRMDRRCRDLWKLSEKQLTYADETRSKHLCACLSRDGPRPGGCR